MILGEIATYYTKYQHIETGRIVEVTDHDLQVKTGDRWQTCITYRPDDADGYQFAVPVDDFRLRFKKYVEPTEPVDP